MKKFTVITKDGSKWLRPVNPHPEKLSTHGTPEAFYYNPEWQEFEKNNFDAPYLGYRPEGTAVYESEVWTVVQYDVNGRWISNEGLYRMGFKFRIAYTDAEPPDIDYEKEMPHKRWPSAKYVARKVGITPFNTQNVRPLVNQLVGEEISFGRFIELLNEIANTH